MYFTDGVSFVGLIMADGAGLMPSTTEGVEIRSLFSFLSPFSPRGARMASIVRWW